MWTLVYSHDNEGRPVEGSVEDLIGAIRSGCPVRYFLDYYGNGEGIYREAELITIKDGVVWVQHTSAVGAAYKPVYFGGDTATPGPKLEMDPPVPDIPYPEDGWRFLDPGYHYFEICGTTGATDMFRWTVGEHSLHRRDHGHFAIQWFVTR